MFYIDSGECPICKSYRTGYFVKGEYQDNNYLLRKIIKGQFVYFKYEIGYCNCFCLDCGNEWHKQLQWKWIKNSELKKIKAEKRITDKYIESMKKELIDKDIKRIKIRNHETLDKYINKSIEIVKVWVGL